MHLSIPESNLPRVVIIGGGFGGIQLARTLDKKYFQVVLFDKNNYHTFQPLLYQVATGGLEPDSIAYPFRKIFRSHILFRMAEVIAVHPDDNTIETSIGKVRYDFLVIATGSKTNFFGLSEIEANAMPMKSITEALDLRSLILQNFEKALLADGIEERESLMNVVVVGGGPTGVETAGALAELKKHVLPNDYQELDFRKMNIYLIEAGTRLLASMSEQASKKALEFLEKVDVQVWLNAGVKSYNGNNVFLSNGKTLLAASLIWSAGVSGNTIEGLNKESIVRGNRMKVDAYNKIDGYNNIFAIGDVAAMTTENNSSPHPMVAQVAIQQGKLLARNLKRGLLKKEQKLFIYSDKGSLATIGRNKAVADLKYFKFQGLFAWFIWMFVHLMTLVGFRNRMVVFVNWMWNYFSYDRGIRLIIRPYVKKNK